MARYAVDTHALVWYLVNSPQLGNQASIALDDCVAGNAQAILSPIVVAELLMMIEKKRTSLSIQAVLTQLQSLPSFHFTGLTVQTVLRTQGLTLLPDIHDRIIVATALEYNASLITHDRMITATGVIKTVW